MTIIKKTNKPKIKIKLGGFYPIPLQYRTNIRYICTGIHDGWFYPTKEEMEIYWLYKDYFGLRG